MKSFLKKLFASVMAITLFLSIFAGCAKDTKEATNNLYISKGTFFQMVIDKFNLYPISCSEEALENDIDFKNAATVICDWNLLPEEEARNGLERKVTKDIVAVVCLNNMYFKTTGNPDDIKDIDKCFDKQGVADAVATGLVSLENGYFDAKQLMTYDDCEEIVDKSLKIDADSHFEEGGTFELDTEGFNVIEDIGDSSSITKIADENENTYEVQEMIYDSATNIIPLGFNNKNEITNCATSTGTNTYKIPKRTFERQKSKFKVGEHIYYTSSAQDTWMQGDSNNLLKKTSRDDFTPPVSFVGILKSIAEAGNGDYLVVIENLPVKETASRIKNEKSGKQINLDPKYFSKVINKNSDKIKKLTGCSISVEGAGKKGIKITASKKIEFKEKKYEKLRSQWRNAKRTPEFKASIQIDNAYVDINDFGDFIFNNKKDALFKFSFDTEETFGATAGPLRYTPDTQGNSKLLNKLERARFVDDDAAGCKRIKVCTIPIFSVGIIGLNLDIYIEVHLDGSIEIKCAQANTLGIENTSGHIKSKMLSDTTETKVEVAVNITGSFDACLSVDIGGKSWIDLSAKPKATLSAEARVWKESSEGYSVEGTGFADEQTLSESLKQEGKDNKWHYDINAELYTALDLQVLTPNSVIGDFFGLNLKKTLGPKKLLTVHIDDGKLVKECTFKALDKNSKIQYGCENISLEAYSANVSANGFKTINVTGLPKGEKTLKRSYRGLRAKIRNEKIANVSVSDDYSYIVVQGKKEGTTTGVVYINKQVGDNKFDYQVEFTVIVSADNVDVVPEVSFASFNILDNLTKNSSVKI